MAKYGRTTRRRPVVGQEVEHSKLHQSTEAEDEADGDVEIQGCDIGHTWEILPRESWQFIPLSAPWKLRYVVTATFFLLTLPPSFWEHLTR